MKDFPHARARAVRLAAAATHEDPDVWAAEAPGLAVLDGRAWLLLDQAARAWQPEQGAAVSGAAGWLGPSLREPSGFVAAVTSMHADGRVRQRATRVLADVEGPLASLALAARLLDHAPQVRQEAERGVLRRRAPADVAAVLDVVLAARRRWRAPETLVLVRSLVDGGASTGLASALEQADRPRARRWALTLAHERGHLSVDRLLADVAVERDQWVRPAFARWLAELADPARLRPLLTSRAADVRLVALTHVPDDVLTDRDLLALLTDAAPRVRDLARRRATTRGIDVAGCYRAIVAGPDVPARSVVACVDGLTAVGDARDLDLLVAALRHHSARVRSAAVDGVARRAGRAEAVTTLGPLLLDTSARVALTAARALGRLGVPAAVGEDAWASPQPWSRRAAWRLSRGRGSWNRVEADLRAATDADPALAGAGLRGIRAWLEHGAATTWAVLPEEQRSRIADLLERAPVGEAQRRALLFHAGLRRSEDPGPVAAVSGGPRAAAGRWLPR